MSCKGVCVSGNETEVWLAKFWSLKILEIRSYGLSGDWLYFGRWLPFLWNFRSICQVRWIHRILCGWETLLLFKLTFWPIVETTYPLGVLWDKFIEFSLNFVCWTMTKCMFREQPKNLYYLWVPRRYFSGIRLRILCKWMMVGRDGLTFVPIINMFRGRCGRWDFGDWTKCKIRCNDSSAKREKRDAG